MVGADDSTEQWRHPRKPLFGHRMTSRPPEWKVNACIGSYQRITRGRDTFHVIQNLTHRYYVCFKNGPNSGSFCVFSFFSHDKYGTNLTIVLGTRTRGGKMVGADESTELGGTPTFMFVACLLLHCVGRQHSSGVQFLLHLTLPNKLEHKLVNCFSSFSQKRTLLSMLKLMPFE